MRAGTIEAGEMAVRVKKGGGGRTDRVRKGRDWTRREGAGKSREKAGGHGGVAGIGK